MNRTIQPEDYIPGEAELWKAIRSMDDEQEKLSRVRSTEVSGEIAQRDHVEFRREFSSRTSGLEAFVNALVVARLFNAEELKARLPEISEDDLKSPERMITLLRETYQAALERSEVSGNQAPNSITLEYDPYDKLCKYKYETGSSRTRVTFESRSGDDLPDSAHGPAGLRIDYDKGAGSTMLASRLKEAGFTAPDTLKSEYDEYEERQAAIAEHDKENQPT